MPLFPLRAHHGRSAELAPISIADVYADIPPAVTRRAGGNMVELVARENASQQTRAKLWPVDEQGQTTIAFRAIWGYQRDMVQFLTQPQTGSADAWKRRLAAMRLQKIESNPLTADEVAMF